MVCTELDAQMKKTQKNRVKLYVSRGEQTKKSPTMLV